jgi:hypothetical protein
MRTPHVLALSLVVFSCGQEQPTTPPEPAESAPAPAAEPAPGAPAPTAPGGQATAPAPAPVGPAVESFALTTTESGDHVGRSTQLRADGAPDHVFTARVSGQVGGFIMTVCENGRHTISQWDTLVGATPAPEGFHWRQGGATWALGVVDAAGTLLNQSDGSFGLRTFDQPTEIRLHAAQNGRLRSGRTICLAVLGQDLSVVASANATLP